MDDATPKDGTLQGVLPKSDYMKGKTFQRSKFLDGTYKTYFGPGQMPDVVTRIGASPFTGNQYAIDYYPPTDWSQQGSLLRPPQVAWLSLSVPYAQSEFFYGVTTNVSFEWYPLSWVGTSTPETLPDGMVVYLNSGEALTWSDGFSIQKTFDDWTAFIDEQGAMQIDDREEWVNERFTFYDKSRKGYLAAYGNTVHTDFSGLSYDFSLNSKLSYVYAPSQFVNQNFADYKSLVPSFRDAASRVASIRRGKTWVQILDYSIYPGASDMFGTNAKGNWSPMFMGAPPGEDFWGVDFLNVFAGSWGAIIGSGDGGAEKAYDDFGKSVLSWSFPRFTRYATKVYGPINASAYNNVVVDSGSLHPKSWPASLILSQYGLESRGTSIVMVDAQDVLPGICGEFADWGFEYKGSQSDLTNADSVVQLIAEHFGFDPNTGEDLPKSSSSA